MILGWTNGEAISPERLMASCERIGLGPEALRDLLYELPLATADSGRISEHDWTTNCSRSEAGTPGCS